MTLGSTRLTRRTLGAVTAAAAAAVAMPSALRNVSAQDQTTITWFTFTAVPDHEEDLQKMIDAFEAANPDVKIEVQSAAYADYFTELQTRI
ncbi:MAG: ABC transporter substrate-binding protein, partial [Thermomicrobiales bacterium]